MAARDIFHNAVKQGLIKDGWTITDDPYILEAKRRYNCPDPTAEKLLGAKKKGEAIAVEITSFLGASLLMDFHLVVGQLAVHQVILSEQDSQRHLYLAVPLHVYKDFFSLEFPQMSVKANRLNFLVYDVENKTIVEWMKS